MSTLFDLRKLIHSWLLDWTDKDKVYDNFQEVSDFHPLLDWTDKDKVCYNFQEVSDFHSLLDCNQKNRVCDNF